jgi:hypothetical protein
MATPFSSNELSNLRELIEKNEWKLNGYIDNYYRYSVHKNKVILFSLKVPVPFPLKLNVPFEVLCFRISIAFKIRNLDQKTYKVILYLMKMLNQLAGQSSIEHNFLITDKEKIRLVELLNLIMPEPVKNENEKAWLNRIRISLNNKREPFKELEKKYLMSIVDAVKNLGLYPTFKNPWELRKGLPKLRTSETLFFSNNEETNMEFFILEKGYFTFYKEIEYNKFIIRSFFESYVPYLLWDLYSENPNFKLEFYVDSWIRFTRELLNSIIDSIKLGGVYQNDFIQFRPEKELESEDFEDNANNFPFSALYYESIISKELYPIQYNLLNAPPDDFEVIESITFLNDAEELFKGYKFQQASVLYEESLKIFNKHHQKKIVVLILLKLAKIASLLNQDNTALNYLKNALELSKSGDISIEHIIIIHYKLGRIYFKIKEYESAMNHFDILLKFLKNENLITENLDIEEYIGMTTLYLALINLNDNNIAEARLHFKNAFNIGSTKSQKVKLKYHLYRAKHFKDKKKYSQSLRILKMAFDGMQTQEEKNRNLIIDLLLEFSEIYVYYRKDIKKAFYYLETTNKLISKKTIAEIYRSVRWNLLMSDYYKFLDRNNENSAYYLSQSRILKAQLNNFGIKD